jgi:hypothetical protein
VRNLQGVDPAHGNALFGDRSNGQVFLKVDSTDGGTPIRGTVHDDAAQDILTGSEGQDSHS